MRQSGPGGGQCQRLDGFLPRIAKDTWRRKVHIVEEWLMSHWDELIGRQSGPLYFRLILQPIGGFVSRDSRRT